MRFLSRTPVRTLFIYPVLVLSGSLSGTEEPSISSRFLPVMASGYLQYRLWSLPHQRGGGGPDCLVSTGPCAFTRDPMYLDHLI